MKPLPIFIFLDEDHRSPLLGSLLARLTPRFKQEGYHQYYDEEPVNQSLENVIEQTEILIHVRDAGEILLPECKQEILEFISSSQMRSSQETYDLMRSHFIGIIEEMANKIKSVDEDSRRAFCRLFYFSNLLGYLENFVIRFDKAILMYNGIIENVLSNLTVDLLTFGPSKEANLRHWHAIKDNNIALKGMINIDGAHDDSQRQTISDAIIKHLDGWFALARNNDVLDKQIADIYLRADQPAFGRNGLAHLEGLQKIFAAQLSDEYAKSNFNFVYVYRTPLDKCTESTKEFRQDLQNGTASLPLGILEINGVDKTEDEIFEEVWMRIRDKILEYQLLPNHLQRFLNDPVVEQRADQLGASYKLFGRVVNPDYVADLKVVENVEAKGAYLAYPH